jgi:hypothetical protein
MRAGSQSRRAIVGAMVGLLYGSILSYLSLFAAGGGHGTGAPVLLSSAPLSVFGLVAWRVGASYVADYAMLLSAPLVWAAIGSLAALSGRGRSLRLTQILVLLHYASGLALVAIFAPDLVPLPSFINVWVIGYVVVWATVYLVGQRCGGE